MKYIEFVTLICPNCGCLEVEIRVWAYHCFQQRCSCNRCGLLYLCWKNFNSRLHPLGTDSTHWGAYSRFNCLAVPLQKKFLAPPALQIGGNTISSEWSDQSSTTDGFSTRSADLIKVIPKVKSFLMSSYLIAKNENWKLQINDLTIKQRFYLQ